METRKRYFLIEEDDIQALMNVVSNLPADLDNGYLQDIFEVVEGLSEVKVPTDIAESLWSDHIAYKNMTQFIQAMNAHLKRES